jgi:2-dehydropantoate 2-reductase
MTPMPDAPAPLRILVVGAGATGGYFGGRLAAAGRDVTFLVRPARAARLAREGLAIRSPHGDVRIAAPAHVVADALREPFDLVLLSCKAYDLDAAIADFAPAVGEATAILPLLNGMRHLDALDARFGAARVLGGTCAISAALDDDGTIVQFNDMHSLSFGERDGSASARVGAIAVALRDAVFDARASEAILRDMWEKWVFLAALAGITCLMRAAVGDIVTAGGRDLALALLEECRETAAASGFAPRDAFMARATAMLSAPASVFTASMLRDIERGGRTEADHVIADLILRRRALGLPAPSVLPLVRLHLLAYEARRAREG